VGEEREFVRGDRSKTVWERDPGLHIFRVNVSTMKEGNISQWRLSAIF
jgi:hypothetical protein